MNRNKIDYGIDLGTTNSAISRMDNGIVTIIQGDDANNSSTIPSCVAFNSKGTKFIGFKALVAYNKEAKNFFKSRSLKPMNAFVEFKRTMGLNNLYTSDYAGRDYSSEELSAEVLKKLKGYVRDEKVDVAVITVPARFEQSQLDATQKAAELAGFEYCELLQEPIAASIAYGINATDRQGKWLVFDFGGGTFDVALLDMDDGIMKVIDTSGDNHLGGKNINDAIIDEIFIPYLDSQFDVKKTLKNPKIRKALHASLKELAEQCKIELATNNSVDIYADSTMYDLGEDDAGEEIIIDFTLNLVEFEKVINPILQKSINITNELLSFNNLKGKDLEKILPVGGTTYLQSLQNMIKNQICDKLDLSENPMTAVSKGAALFASTRDIPPVYRKRDASKIQLELKYPETTVEVDENIGLLISRDLNSHEISTDLNVELKRTDGGWSSGILAIVEDIIVIEVVLEKNKANNFEINLSDSKGRIISCEPSSITIIQGLKNPNATLPFPICIDAFDNEKGISLLEELKGLGKNQSLPAKGIQKFKINKDLRPGNTEDIVNIDVYEGEPRTKKEYNQFVRRIKISGADVPEYIPSGSDIEITLKIDSSRRVTLSAYFPYIDDTVETSLEDIQVKEQNAEEIEILLNKARQKLNSNRTSYTSLDNHKVNKIDDDLIRLTDLLNNRQEDSDTKFQIFTEIRKISIDLDKLEKDAEWPQVEEELNECLKTLKLNQDQYGTTETLKISNELENYSINVISNKDVKRANELIKQIRELDYQLISQDIGFWVAILFSLDEKFNMHDWKDREQAIQLLNKAKEIVSTQPTLENVKNIVVQLFSLMPDSEQPPIPKGPTSDLSR